MLSRNPSHELLMRSSISVESDPGEQSGGGGECPRGGNVLGGKCPRGKCPGGGRPGGKRPGGKSPVTVLPYQLHAHHFLLYCVIFTLPSKP